MPTAEQVNPMKWTNHIVVYDNGEYSAIWGNYENSVKRCLGVRWNRYDGGRELGFPNQSGYPIWYVEPDYLAKVILLELHSKAVRDKDERYWNNLNTALYECKNV